MSVTLHFCTSTVMFEEVLDSRESRISRQVRLKVTPPKQFVLVMVLRVKRLNARCLCPRPICKIHPLQYLRALEVLNVMESGK